MYKRQPEVRGQYINQAEEIGDGLSLIRLVSPGGLSPLNDESEISYTPIMSSSEVTMDLPMKEVHDPIKLINNFQPTGISYDFGVKLNGIAKSNFNDFEFKNDNHLAVSYTHLRAHETTSDLVCRLLLEVFELLQMV